MPLWTWDGAWCSNLGTGCPVYNGICMHGLFTGALVVCHTYLSIDPDLSHCVCFRLFHYAALLLALADSAHQVNFCTLNPKSARKFSKFWKGASDKKSLTGNQLIRKSLKGGMCRITDPTFDPILPKHFVVSVPAWVWMWSFYSIKVFVQSTWVCAIVGLVVQQIPDLDVMLS